MLVLSRRKNERLRLTTKYGEVIEVVMVKVQAGQVKLGIVADEETVILRGELFEERKAG